MTLCAANGEANGWLRAGGARLQLSLLSEWLDYLRAYGTLLLITGAALHAGSNSACPTRGTKPASLAKPVTSFMSSGILGDDSELTEAIIPFDKVTASLLPENGDG